MFPKFLIKVQNYQRVLIAKNGRFHSILKPGIHVLPVHPFAAVETEVHNVRRLVFTSRWADHLYRSRPEVIEEHFKVVKTDHSQVAMVYVNGSLYQALLPGKRLFFWKDAADIRVEVINMVETPVISDSMLTALEDRQHAYSNSAVDDSGSSFLFEELFEQSAYSEITCDDS